MTYSEETYPELEYEYRRWLPPEQVQVMNNELHMARKAFRCKCQNKEVRYKMSKTNFKMFYLQCVDCGESRRLAKNKVTQPHKATPFDETVSAWEHNQELARPAVLKVIAKYRQIATDIIGEKQERYSEYLLSPKWRRKRAMVLKRAKGMCEGCGTNKATQVHHLTYDRIYQEMLFDLVAVCDDCHNIIHDNEGK